MNYVHSSVKYYNFNYPQPVEWAFPKPLVLHLKKKARLTFNWNTKGAGYSVESGTNKIYALNHTGALPVSYISEGSSLFGSSEETTNAEDTGYKYFAERNDPNLTRVVQYAAFYQIFSAFGIAKSAKLPQSDTRADLALNEIYNNFVVELTGLSDEQALQLSQELLPFTQKLSQAATIPKRKQEFIAQETKRIEEELELEGVKKGTTQYSEKLQQELKRVEEVFADIEKRLPKTPEQIVENLKALKQHQPAILGEGITLSALITFKKIPDVYSQKSEPTKNVWIHSQVIVVSEAIEELSSGSGGHNLSARVTKFKVGTVPVGRRIIRDVQGNLVVSPQDAGKIKGLLSSYKQLTKDGYSEPEIIAALDILLLTEPTLVPRSKQEALNYSQEPPAPPKTQINAPIGWADGKEPLPNVLLADYKASQRAVPGIISVKKNSETEFLITHSEFAEPLKASNKEDVADIST